jgi:superfamily II DNA or RNA helicase
MNHLLEYQIPHAERIINILQNKNICIDGSDTGTGKTYVALHIIKFLKLKPLIICPKTIISSWLNVAKIFDIKLLGVVNYETITKGKYYINNNSIIRGKCPYININESSNNYYEWNMPENSIIIFDEAHHCCNENTLNAKLLLSLQSIYTSNLKVLLLSASIAYNQLKFKVFGFLLKWYESINWAPDWIKNPNFNSTNASMMINKKLYPEFGSRMNIKDLGDLFPQSKISGEAYDIKNYKEIDKQYKDLEKSIEDIKNKKLNDMKSVWVQMMRARQAIEIYKIPLFIDLTKEYLNNNYSVVIFVNFKETIDILSKKLNTKCIVSGEQSLKLKENNIYNFVSNLEKVIICNIQSGSEAISLNDKDGLHPRISLISPTWSSVKLTQAFGRTQRADSKSVALNRIIFCAKTIEEKICNKINEKIKNMNIINDNDINLLNLTIE